MWWNLQQASLNLRRRRQVYSHFEATVKAAASIDDSHRMAGFTATDRTHPSCSHTASGAVSERWFSVSTLPEYGSGLSTVTATASHATAPSS